MCQFSFAQNRAMKVEKSLQSELQRLASNPSEIWLCAHRANTYDGKKVSSTPENSLEALKKAIDAGANFAEIDVRTTSDGHFVIMHDATLNRTTNASGNVSDKTLAQLKAFKLRADNNTITNCTIPTLTEMLLAGRGKIYFDLDLKDVRNMRKLIQLVDSLSMTDRVMYYVSTKKDIASEIIDEQPRSVIFPWVSTVTDVNYWAAKPYSSVAHVDYQVSGAAAVIDYAHQNGLATFANSLWSAGDDALLGNDFSYIDMMKNMHVRIIQTDYTEKIKEYLY
jgi:glycerophosphoryl diester phosphodiesterase